MTRLRPLVAADPALTDTPGTYANGHDMAACHAGIAARVRPNRKRLNIMSALATGWLPWGVEWAPYLCRRGNSWILCCGHVLNFKHAQEFVAAGLLIETKDQRNDDALTITKAGKVWLQSHWPS